MSGFNSLANHTPQPAGVRPAWSQMSQLPSSADIPSQFGPQTAPPTTITTSQALPAAPAKTIPPYLPPIIAFGILVLLVLWVFAPYVFVIGLVLFVGGVIFYFKKHRSADAPLPTSAAGFVEEATRMAQAEARAQALPMFQKGHSQMRDGHLNVALSIFKGVKLSGGLKTEQNKGYECPMLLDMGLCASLLGWIPEAQNYRTEAASLLPPTELPRLLLLDVLVACRAGNSAQALQIGRTHWAAGEKVLSPEDFRSLKILTAFALEQTGQAQSPDFRFLLENTRPLTPREFSYLGSEWPQMRDFLVRFNLASF